MKTVNGIGYLAAEPTDAVAILAYLKQVGGETDNLSFGGEGMPITVEQEAQFITDTLASDRDLMLLAKEGEQIVGCGTLNTLPRRMAHRAEIGISVVKAAWGKGIGTQLLQMLIDFAAAHDVAILSLDVRCDNDRAIRLYQRFGFEIIGRFPGFSRIDGKDIDFFQMALRLPEK